MVITLPDSRTLRLIKSGESRRSSTDETWYGKTENGGEVTVVRVGSQISAGIRDTGRVYEIKNLDGSYHVLYEVDLRALPPDHPPELPIKPSSRAVQPQKEAATTLNAASGGSANINILVAYTPGAGSAMGSPSAEIQRAVDGINSSFANSSVNLRVTLVGITTVPVDYSSSSSALSGTMNALPILMTRDKANADIVAIVGNFADACGTSAQVLAVPLTAFVSVTASCLNSNLSLAHELGHLLGARHDIANDPSSSPFVDGHGHVSGPFLDAFGNLARDTCVHTMMAYSRPSSVCTYDPRMNYWSNPSVNYTFKTPQKDNIPTGVAGRSNVARVLNYVGPSIAEFRKTKLAEGPMAAISAVTSGLFAWDSD